MQFTLPPRLRRGDKVAIVSPSSGLASVFPWVYEQGLRRIRDIFELEPIEFPTARKSSEYLSNNPKARADDINAAFQDPSIKAIIATIGGNDQIRILPYLDKKIISANPKIFMGYSDCTNLHLFLWNLGLISYYGGAVMTQFAMGKKMHEYTIDSIKKALFSPTIGTVYAAAEWSDADLDWQDQKNLDVMRPQYKGEGWIWHNMKDQIIQGPLWGGCLEVLDLHLAVKRYVPNFDHLDGSILYIETSEEMPPDTFVYRFISALCELELIQRFKAILVGFPKAQYCGKEPLEGRNTLILNQQKAVQDALREYESTIPVVFNLNFGHTDPQIIIPNGGTVVIDGSQKTIQFC